MALLPALDGGVVHRTGARSPTSRRSRPTNTGRQSGIGQLEVKVPDRAAAGVSPSAGDEHEMATGPCGSEHGRQGGGLKAAVATVHTGDEVLVHNQGRAQGLRECASASITRTHSERSA